MDEADSLLSFAGRLPDPVAVFSQDGTLVYLNQALLHLCPVDTSAVLIGRYNLLTDPLLASTERIEAVCRAFEGEAMEIARLPVPRPVEAAGFSATMLRNVRLVRVAASPSRWLIVALCPESGSLRSMEERLRSSEERFRALVECSSDVIMVVDASGVLAYVSPSSHQLLGYGPERLLGTSAFDLVHPSERLKARRAFDTAIHQTDRIASLLVRCRHSDGSWRVLSIRGISQLDNPSIGGFIASARDMTEQQKSQELLRQSEEKFRGIVEQSSDGISLMDDTGTVIEYNASLERMSGIRRDAALGRKIWDVQYDVVPREQRTARMHARLVALYKRFLETSGEEWLSRTIETVMERDDATRVTVETVVFRITTNRGPVYASFSRDVTELHRTRNQLMARERELVERNELLQQKNIALREVLSQLEREKKRLGDQVQINADRFVIPLVEQLRSVAPAGLHQYLDAIKDNLGELTLPFGQSISRPLLRLSKREIEVCNAIRQGMSCKEVADLMSISVRTVETHRNRIRRKLGIVDPAVNLTTYLQSLGGD